MPNTLITIESAHTILHPSVSITYFKAMRSKALKMGFHIM